MVPISIHLPDGRALAGRALRTENSFERAQGWLGRAGVELGEGLLIAPCASIHSIGMKFSFDLAFLDRQGRLLSLRHSLAPGRLAWAPWRSLIMPWRSLALELPAGTLKALGAEPSMQLRIDVRPA